jgi:hypothetical protein
MRLWSTKEYQDLRYGSLVAELAAAAAVKNTGLLVAAVYLL